MEFINRLLNLTENTRNYIQSLPESEQDVATDLIKILWDEIPKPSQMTNPAGQKKEHYHRDLYLRCREILIPDPNTKQGDRTTEETLMPELYRALICRTDVDYTDIKVFRIMQNHPEKYTKTIKLGLEALCGKNNPDKNLIQTIILYGDIDSEYTEKFLLEPGFPESLRSEKGIMLGQIYRVCTTNGIDPMAYISTSHTAESILAIMENLSRYPENPELLNFAKNPSFTSAIAINTLVQLQRTIPGIDWLQLTSPYDTDCCYLDIEDTILKHPELSNIDEIISLTRQITNNKWLDFNKNLDLIYRSLYGNNPQKIYQEWQTDMTRYNIDNTELALYLYLKNHTDA